MPKKKSEGQLPFQEEVRFLVEKKGARLFEIKAKDGRWLVKHRVVLTAKGQLLFPDHAMCTVRALLTELDMSGLRARIDDCCYLLAAFVFNHSNVRSKLNRYSYRGADLTVFGVPVYRYRKTEVLQKVWGGAYDGVIDPLVRKITTRAYAKRITDPVTLGLPFSLTGRHRVEKALLALSARVNAKVARLPEGMSYHKLNDIYDRGLQIMLSRSYPYNNQEKKT